MAQQNLNIGLSREQIRAAVQADFVELYAALNSAYGTNLVPRLLNSGLSDSQVLDFTRANFADLYAAVKAQGLTGAPRYLNAGLSSDQLRAATQANFTDLYTLLGGANFRSGLLGAIWGDSRAILGLNSSQSYSNRSFVQWARLYSNQAFDAPAALNFGVSGNTTTQMLTRASTVLASYSDFVIILGPSPNDVGVIAPGDANTPGTSIYNLNAMINAVLPTGRRVLLATGTPRTDLSGQNLTDYLAVRDWCRTQVGRQGVVIAETWNAMATAASGYQQGDPAMFVADGVHQAVKGARTGGQVLAAAALTFIASRDILPVDNTVWSSGTSLGVNLITNATMVGGTTVASNWSVTNNAGGTAAVVSSKSTIGSYTAQQVAISGTPSGAGELFVRLEQSLDVQVPALAQGNAFEAGLLVHVDAGVSGVRSLELFIVSNANVIDGQYDSGDVTAAYQLDGSAFTGILRTLPYIFTGTPSSTLRYRLRAVGLTGVPMAITFRASRAYLKRLS